MTSKSRIFLKRESARTHERPRTHAKSKNKIIKYNILTFAHYKIKKNCIFLQKYLVISKKSSIFAPSIEKDIKTNVNFTYSRLCFIHKNITKC